MKPFFNYLLVSLLFIKAPCVAQEFDSTQSTFREKFTITGKISGLPDGAQVFILYSDSRPKNAASIKNGLFTFSGYISEPLYVSIFLSPDWEIKDGGPVIHYKNFFLEKGKTEITGSSIAGAKIIGGPTQKLYVESGLSNFKESRDSALVSVYFATMSPKKDSTTTAMLTRWTPILEQRQAAYRAAALTFIKTHNDSFISLLIMSAELMNDSLFDDLNPNLKTSILGKKLAALFIKEKELGIGKLAPNFTQPDILGNPIALNTFLGKYVLVEFWASWCKPCRAESPYLIKAYEEFKEKKFEILSVSFDEHKANWLKAIKEDKTTWIHVSDLKKENAVKKAWGITAVPINYLLDPQGKIIAMNLRGDDLLNKLRNTLQ